MLKEILSNAIVRLILAVLIGLLVGLAVSEPVLRTVMVVKQITGQTISLLVPLIILGFVTPSIACSKSNASKVLLFAFSIVYLPSVGAATSDTVVGYESILHSHIQTVLEGLKDVPPMSFNLEIPPVVSVISALILVVILGLSIVRVKSKEMEGLLEVFQNMVLKLVKRVLIPILPLFIAANFCVLSYEGAITKQLSISLSVLLIVIACYYIWLTLLYVVTSIYSRKGSRGVLKYCGPAYLTALGTMSPVVTLGTASTCAKKSKILRGEVAGVTIPLFANIHLCDPILTGVFFVLTVSQILYGSIPDFTMIFVFIVLLGFFAIDAPSISGDTVFISLGLIIAILGLDETGMASLLTIFALQGSFDTACNMTGDGVPTLITDTFDQKWAEKALMALQGQNLMTILLQGGLQ